MEPRRSSRSSRPGAPAGELGRLRAEAEAAHRERRSAASAFAAARRAGLDPEPAREAYRASQQRLEASEAEVRRLAAGPGAAPVNDVNYIFPSYVVSQLRGGLAGLVIAVIFAAAMSTLAAELSSLATATVVDFYKRFVNACRHGRARPAGVARVHRGLGDLRGASWHSRPDSWAPRSRS